jgi:hypothetical protein
MKSVTEIQEIRNIIHDYLKHYFNLPDLPEFTSNTAAIAGGITPGQFYKNGDNVCIAHM